jgi:hypothetical protein
VTCIVDPSQTLSLDVTAFHREAVGSPDVRHDGTIENQFARGIDSRAHRITFRWSGYIDAEKKVWHKRESDS